MIGNAALVIVTFLVGWVALWPARRALGAWDYHLAALPVGIVGWTAAAGAAGLVVRPMTWPVVVPAVVAYAGIIFWVLRSWICAGRQDGPAPALWTYAVAGGLVGVATIAATLSRLTIVGYDSWAHYQSSAIYLADHGRPSAAILGEYGPLIPSVIAAGRMFGGDWIYSVYPVMALDLLLFTVVSAFRVAEFRVSRRAAAVLAILTGLVLLLTKSFATDSFYVHSQMYSALFLALAVVPVILLALREEFAELGTADQRPAEPTESDARALAVLLVSGVATAGLALTRPDGLVYVFVPMLVVVALRFQRGWGLQRLVAYAGPLLAVLAASYIGAFLRLHAWKSDKMSGKTAFMILVLMAVVPVIGEVLARWDRVAWLRRGHNAIRAMLVFDVLGVAGAAAVARQKFVVSAKNMVTNLFSTGGYEHLWYFLAGVVLVTIVLGILKCGDGPAYTLFAIAQFFAVALVVHGVTHPGRLSPADSFNRVAFHIVPVILFYTAASVAVFWSARAARKDAA